MVVDKQVPPILEWLFGESVDSAGVAHLPVFWSFVITAIILAIAGLAISFLVAAFRYGPVRALRVMGKSLITAPIDLLLISPRRVYGLAGLAVREAHRRHVWIVLLMFAVVLMFAGWFLSPDSDEPAVLYLDFVLSSATILLMPLAIFLGAFSLPTDIKNRTIYTVATKPVRASEIVLGRILGFSIVAAILLMLMGAASYIFVARGLSHTHELTMDDLTAQRAGREVVRYEGETSRNSRHRHKVSIDARQFTPEIEVGAPSDDGMIPITATGDLVRDEGLRAGDVLVSIDGDSAKGLSRDAAVRRLRGLAGSTVSLTVRRSGSTQQANLTRTIMETYTQTNRGHRHRVTARWTPDDGTSGELAFTVGPAEGMLKARVPLYGQLEFVDSRGIPKDRGDSIGKIVAYRSYIRGNTLASAVWTFDGIDGRDYPAGLPLDVNIRVYRSHLGQIEEGVKGAIVVRNPDPKKNLRSRERIFTAKEFTIDRIDIPRKLLDQNGRQIDLFDDLVEDGKTEVVIRCLNGGQYFGVAEADVYVRAQDASYEMNFAKGLVGIWLQLVLVTALAVLFSTFLSAPVAMLLTCTSVIVGYNKNFLGRLAVHVVSPERMKDYATHERIYGGGPIEAFYRILMQDNLVSKLEEGPLTTVIKNTDWVLMQVVEKLLHLLPDFKQFVEVEYLSHGYDIQPDLLLQHILATLAFLLAAYVIGYFFLKTRELAA